MFVLLQGGLFRFHLTFRLFVGVYLGYGPLTVTVVNEGLGWDPLLKMFHNPGGDSWGPHPSYNLFTNH